MTFLKFDKKLNEKTKKLNTVMVFKCNALGCPNIFVRTTMNKKRDLALEFHFCNRECTNKERTLGGLLHVKFQQTCLEKYGVESPSQNSEIKEKIRETNVKRYGFDSHFQSEQIKEKIRNTNIERYGTPFPLNDREINIKRYGVENAFQSEEIKEKIRETNVKRYGVEYPSQNSEIKEKMRETNIKRYGVENPMGVPEFVQKVHETKKKNGSYNKSKAEDRCYEHLCPVFGEHNVVRQKLLNGWSIDFYVVSFDLYIQFDGYYYHGKGRDLEEIAEFKTETDKTIYQTVLRDQEQNLWCTQNNINFMRIEELSFEEFLDKKAA